MDPALLLVAGLAFILLLQFSRVRRQQREVRATQAALEVGAEVLTASGMIATVVDVTGATVILAGEDGHRTRWVSGAVVRVLAETDPASSRFRDPTAVDPATDVTGTTDAPGDDAPGTTGSTRQD